MVICSRQLNYAIIQRILTSFERFHAVVFQITFIISSSDESLLDFTDSRISFVKEPDEHYSLNLCSTASWEVAVDRSRFQLVLMLGHSMSLTGQNDLNFAASVLKSMSSLDLDKIHAVGFCGTPTRKDGLHDCLRYPSHCMICETSLMRDKLMFVKVEMGRRFECYESSKNDYQAFLLGKASANKLLRRCGSESQNPKAHDGFLLCVSFQVIAHLNEVYLQYVCTIARKVLLSCSVWLYSTRTVHVSHILAASSP